MCGKSEIALCPFGFAPLMSKSQYSRFHPTNNPNDEALPPVVRKYFGRLQQTNERSCWGQLGVLFDAQQLMKAFVKKLGKYFHPSVDGRGSKSVILEMGNAVPTVDKADER